MNNEDYQLEEMENSAVNKSAMAKRAAAGAGLLAAGAATAYGAEQLIGDGEPAVEPSAVEQPDLTSGATAGAVEEGMAEQPQPEPEPQPQTVHTEETVHVYVHPDPQPQPEPEPEPDIEFESTTHLYDNEGNLVGTMDAGTLDGKDFIVLDGDADGKGDVLWYDDNGDGKIQDNEKVDISDGNYAMGSHGGEHRDVNIETGELIPEEIAHNPMPEPNIDPVDPYVDPYNPEEPIARIDDIDNDYKYSEYDAKAHEEYHNDLAQNNPDYNNNGNVDQYRAGGESSSEEPVLEEEPMSGMPDAPTGEEHYADYHEDINGEEYADPTEEPLLAEDDTLLEEDTTDEYALTEEDATEDGASEDMAYEDGGEIENDIDDTAEDDLAYNDDAESGYDDSVDDTDQYDIV